MVRQRLNRVLAVVTLGVAVPLVMATPAFAKRPPPTTTTTSSTTTSTTTTTTTTTLPPGTTPTIGGYDIAWPQCSKPVPPSPAFGIVGVSNGLAFSDNPCLAAEYAWASSATRAPAVYMNTADPGPQSTRWTLPGPKACSGASDDLGCVYNYGWNAAAHAFAYATAQGANPSAWWLDIETANTWSTNLAANVADIQGMVDYLRGQGRTVGVYSTRYQWGQITGGLSLAVPNWVAGASKQSQAVSWCTPSKSFTGGPVALVQYPAGTYDGDVPC
jgi:hypothetical protein